MKVFAVFDSIRGTSSMVGVFTTPERAIAFARTQHEAMVQGVDVDSDVWEFDAPETMVWAFDDSHEQDTDIACTCGRFPDHTDVCVDRL